MIILAGTPIGNLQDASLRLRDTLENATVVAAEDTRKTIQLLRLLGIENRPELISLNDHNESNRAVELVERARSEDIVVVSDAGMPTISDPGFRLVQLAAREGVEVTIVPGPSAVTTALAVSGLPTNRFAFEGFVPRKESERKKLLSWLKNEHRTTIFFESPTRLASTLQDFAEALGREREAVVCRELTKLYEEVRRGSLKDLYDWAKEGVRGEIVLLIGPSTTAEMHVEDVLQSLIERVRLGERLKDVAREISEQTGISSKQLYESALRHQKDSRI
ncbi:MAG TPA: 16S rRNA (cytidine(1402)-2'-O)-methyltransferase [Microbacteriaceae bacterium]|nr:16S rRNA (cytidine(1402)-2'-O)-methyltransferase [Microbacteriaceae bacterium]